MNVYEARKRGREYCQTEGSEHYKEGGIEPLDLMISKGLAEDFCICNMVKYAIRFKRTRNCDDLKKVADYAHILCGVEVGHKAEAKPNTCGTCMHGKDFDEQIYCNRDIKPVRTTHGRSCEHHLGEG